jgi:hypothetical protein
VVFSAGVRRLWVHLVRLGGRTQFVGAFICLGGRPKVAPTRTFQCGRPYGGRMISAPTNDARSGNLVKPFCSGKLLSHFGRATEGRPYKDAPMRSPIWRADDIRPYERRVQRRHGEVAL